MSHKKGQGSARNGSDSNAQRRGIKAYGGEHVWPGCVIVRQCGTRWHPGPGVGMGRDYTIYATREGVVKFLSRKRVCVDLPAVVEQSS